MLMAGTIALTPLAGSASVAMVLLATAACGGGGISTTVTADLLARVPAHRASTAGAALAASQSLAYVIFAPIIGFSIDRTHGYAAALVGLGVLVVGSGFVFVLWPGISRPLPFD